MASVCIVTQRLTTTYVRIPECMAHVAMHGMLVNNGLMHSLYHIHMHVAA